MTDKRQIFIMEYLIDLNATEAAKRAGYSEKTAYSQGQRLLKNVEVRKRIEDRMNELKEKTGVTQEQVIGELCKLAFGDMADVVTWGPRGVVLKDSAGLTPDQRAAIQEVAETVTKEGGSTRIRRYDKVKALELLGKHLGLFTDVRLKVDEPPKLELYVNGQRREDA